MRSTTLKSILKTAMFAVAGFLLTASASFAQQQVNLTAGAATATMPDGTAVPMWGYSCGAAVGGSTATCAALNKAATGWCPVIITVPTGQGLTINLTNGLTFGANGIPTSLTIVGQLGGGLGDVSQRTTTNPPDHSNSQPLTWPIAGDAPGAPLTGVGTAPTQSPRVQSFATEVAAGTTTAVTWAAAALRPGTYLLESGTHPSIQGPMGLYGMVVVTTAPSGVTPGTAYPAAGATAAVTYSAEVPLLMSEIDPVQNAAVNAAVNTTGFSETMVWSGLPGGCGNSSSPSFQQCYPPAVNYTPLFYTFNGVAFNKTNTPASLFAATPGTVATPVSGNVLVRFVNAGLRMHVPSIVGSLTTQTTGATPVSGFSLIAEDGNTLPGIPRVQSEVFMAAGKTYDVMINVPAAGAPAIPVYDRELSLSGNKTSRDSGMLAYIGINGAALPATGAFAVLTATAVNDTYNSLTPCVATPCPAFTVAIPSKGVIANDTNVFNVKLLTPPTHGTVTLNADGTFTYVPSAPGTTPDTFVYEANGNPAIFATVSLGACTAGSGCLEAGSGITVNSMSFTSNVATSLSIKSPGILAVDSDSKGFPLSVATATVAPGSGAGVVGLSPCAGGSTTNCVAVDSHGGFNAYVPAAGTYTFTYKAQNSQGTTSASSATVTLIFPTATGLAVTVQDGKTGAAITDYRWVIEEDRTFYIDPKCTSNPPAAGCPTAGSGIVPTFGTNFHTSYMPLVATGCVGPAGAIACETGQTVLDPATGAHLPAVCDIGNGVCRTTGSQQNPLDPSQVHLDPTKRYYISVLPGDAGNSFENLNGCLSNPTPSCGHGMGGAPIAAGQTAVKILAQANPFPPSKLSVFVFEDDFPLNGEQDGGGGVDVLSPNEPGLGQFNITLFDDAGGTGDATGQMTYDMFNQPLVNSLSGQIDPSTGFNACPISINSRVGTNPDGTYDKTQTGITGTIVTCPKFENGKDSAGNLILSPLAGQAVVANLMPGRYGVVATPGADRIAKGEEWLQTNTLDGQKAHDSFLRIGEPSFFQEFGPAGYHVSIGFANPQIINSRLAGVCNGSDPTITGNCKPGNTVTGIVTTERMSRTPDERLFSSGDNSSFAFTQCYVSFGDPDGEDFAFTKCNGDGTFSLSGLPDGDWRVTVFDQWNDMLVDGLSTPVRLSGGATAHFDNLPGGLGQIATNQWQANIYTKTFFDRNGNGIQDSDEPGLTLLPTNIRFRDGSYSNFNNTDLNGNAGFNEEFPLFSWYVVESDTTRYKNTGTHVVYDAGGPSDGSTCGGTTGTACGNSVIGHFLANTAEQISVPSALRVPGAYYCANADCTDAPTPFTAGGTGGSTGRVDPAWVLTEGWQGFSGQNSFIEFGKKPFLPGETGGIHGEVIYASTRPFDDPGLLIHTSWTPDVPGVTINLYQEGTAPDGSQSLTLVDTTKTSSWDDWAQGFRGDGNPNMNCPGQGTSSGTNADLFFFSLFNQPMWLDSYNNGGTPAHTIPNNSQYKCYDGMHNWNQVQPAPFDGRYQFPSIVARDSSTGVPVGGAGSRPGTNCTICVANVDTTDPTPMLPPGKYVVEVVVPPGYELVKEEDKNILIGDNYIAPVTQEFGGLGNVFILPDQAEVGAAYNPNNAQNSTVSFGRSTLPSNEGDTGSVETFWPCVGASRIVPDYISLFPGSAEVAPFAGATRNLCDRKEVTLNEQASALAKFWVFTSAHVAAHFTGVITDDFTSEFDPFSPQFGEKFAPPNLPISLKDWTGTEISRVYSDHWGAYDGLTYSTWEVNPPNPTGYAPTMMVVCMNDPGTGPTPDPLFNPQYSQFCYEIPFMPGQTQYMDTPVTPTSAFAGAGYNNPDCAYPALTPAIKEVDSNDGVGPWVSASGTGHTLTITALGDQIVPNNGYSGPSNTTAPYNQKTISRHYGFGSGGTVALVGADGVSHPLTGVNWTDGTITGTVPSGVPNCTIQQQAQYGGSTAKCGELVITRGDNGKQSIDTVTVTIGGKAPTHVLASASIQSAIDLAKPGDLIIVDPTCTAAGVAGACATAGSVHSNSNHTELLVMWKPVRLQGVGAASSIINANTHPAGKMDAWRTRVACLFGLAPSGTPNGYDRACGAGWVNFNPTSNNPQIDRLPLEATVGWDATLNGNLAELLQEPTLMGALEGAGITVLSKGVRFPSNPFAADTFPTGTTLLTSSNCSTSRTNPTNPFPSNFQCNPSSIDGLAITNSSQGGGGIFVHAWGHNLQIANNRVYNNSGTLTGGISVGQGEFPPAYLAPNNSATNAAPGSCQDSNVTNLQLPDCFDLNVNVHNNMITSNSSTGDELFSATPAGAGGVSFCTGADFYKFNYNWVCGNLSTGDGGGIGHIGFIYNGDIEHNTILFNQSTNPTIPANGGGLLVMGAPDVDPPCSTVDQDCLSAPNLIGPSDGSGPGLVINANLIMGNAADSGSGGGLRLQNINGSEVVSFPTSPSRWYSINVTNNIIANNVAGWDGAGVSLQDALAVNFINNTVMSNDTTASSGVLFNTFGAPLASSSGPTCTSNCGTASAPQPAGLVAIQNSAILSANLPGTVTCPPGHFAGGSATNGTCRNVSYPVLENDVFWQNRSFYIGVGSLGAGTLNQQNVVDLYNAFTTTRAVTQPQTDATTANGSGAIITGGTGACVSPASYWDIGVRGDTSPSNRGPVTLAPAYSLITDFADYAAAALHNTGLNPTVVSQYCNGSRVPPELGTMGYQVPPGISDATVPNPVFNLTPAATVDEGNNWINISWGPLAETNPVNGALLGNYTLAPGSPAQDSALGSVAPSTDFFGTARPQGCAPDIGAFEIPQAPAKCATVSPTSLAFGNVPVTTSSASQTLTVQNTGSAAITGGITVTVTAPFLRSGGTCSATTTLAVGNGNASRCTITVVFTPTALGPANGTVTVSAAGTTVIGTPVALTGTGVAIVRSATFTPTSWSPSANPGVGAGFLCFGGATPVGPCQMFTLTNTGNVPITGIAQGALGGANPADYSIVRFLSTCGPTGGGQFLGQTSLAPGSACVVTVQFLPRAADAHGSTRNATVSVTDILGTQSSTLLGHAN
jgi:hypothetical protein